MHNGSKFFMSQGALETAAVPRRQDDLNQSPLTTRNDLMPVLVSPPPGWVKDICDFPLPEYTELAVFSLTSAVCITDVVPTHPPHQGAALGDLVDKEIFLIHWDN